MGLFKVVLDDHLVEEEEVPSSYKPVASLDKGAQIELEGDKEVEEPSKGNDVSQENFLGEMRVPEAD